jgi:uncharacterized protein (TIGR00255 family)
MDNNLIISTSSLSDANSYIFNFSGKLDKLQNCLDELLNLSQVSNERLREKLKQRLQTWYSGQFDPQRFDQELVLQLMRLDTAEELERLSTHLQEFRRVLQLKQECGRRLDFLVQECHREVNTIGSKTDDAKVSSIVIDMKVIIEQLREQIQNVE